MKKFTEKELSQCNGKNGNPLYVAYKGKVYNVSDSFLWKEGKHQALHSAGKDLTNALEQAPHGDDVLRKFPIVGTFQDKIMSNTSSKQQTAC